MKPTLRKNGRKMFTVRVDFHFGREELIAVVADAILSGETVKPARRALVELMRKGAKLNGYYYTHQAHSEEDVYYGNEKAEAETRAATIVDAAFPELAGGR